MISKEARFIVKIFSWIGMRYEYEQMQHVWVGFPIPEAKEAMEEAIAFVEK